MYIVCLRTCCGWSRGHSRAPFERQWAPVSLPVKPGHYQQSEPFDTVLKLVMLTGHALLS